MDGYRKNKKKVIQEIRISGDIPENANINIYMAGDDIAKEKKVNNRKKNVIQETPTMIRKLARMHLEQDGDYNTFMQICKDAIILESRSYFETYDLASAQLGLQRTYISLLMRKIIKRVGEGNLIPEVTSK